MYIGFLIVQIRYIINVGFDVTLGHIYRFCRIFVLLFKREEYGNVSLLFIFVLSRPYDTGLDKVTSTTEM